jgi:hypothetical protein
MAAEVMLMRCGILTEVLSMVVSGENTTYNFVLLAGSMLRWVALPPPAPRFDEAIW